MSDCMCSLEYGPCEDHGVVLVVREGASHRTADELALCLIDDLVDGGWGELSPYGADVVARVRGALAACDGSCAWLDDADLESDLFEVADQVEASASDVFVAHEDGYVISQPSEDFWAIVEGWAYSPVFDR